MNQRIKTIVAGISIGVLLAIVCIVYFSWVSAFGQGQNIDWHATAVAVLWIAPFTGIMGGIFSYEIVHGILR